MKVTPGDYNARPGGSTADNKDSPQASGPFHPSSSGLVLINLPLSFLSCHRWCRKQGHWHPSQSLASLLSTFSPQGTPRGVSKGEWVAGGQRHLALSLVGTPPMVDMHSSFCFLKYINNLLFHGKSISPPFSPCPPPPHTMEHADLLMQPIKTAFCCILGAISESKHHCLNRGQM